MTLSGVTGPLDNVAENLWANVTEHFIADEIREKIGEGLIESVGVNITSTVQNPPFVARRLSGRSLQADQTLTFDAIISIQSVIEDHDVKDYIGGAFNSDAEKVAYLENLKATGHDTFANVTAVTLTPAKIVTPLETIYVDDGNDKNSAAGVGIIVGMVAVGLAGIGLAGFYIYSRRKKRALSQQSPSSNEIESDFNEIEVGTRDEVSTLGDPIPPELRNDLVADSAFSSTSDSLTLDYDYQKAYRNAQVSVVDSQSASNPSMSVYKDDVTLEAEYVSEETFEVEAPPGLLGLVLETSDDGVPMVHAIKGSSCLSEQVQVGDQLLSVDGEDVTGILASAVSRLIASKKDNPVRRFVFRRPEQ